MKATDAFFKHTVAALLGDIFRLVARQGGDDCDLMRCQKIGQPFKAIFLKDREVAAIDDLTPDLVRGFDKQRKVVRQLWRTTGDVHNLRRMCGDPLTNSLCSGFIQHLTSPRCRIDMTMAAGLVTFAAHVELERDELVSPEIQFVTRELFFETIHLRGIYKVDARRKHHNHSQVIMARGEPGGGVVVITGAARGLGRAMALEFASLGHRVIGCSRNEKKLAGLTEKLGAGHSLSVVDVADDNAVAAWADVSLEEFGAPDLLLNNAAVINKSKFLWELTALEFDEVVDINIKGVANVIRHFLPAMTKASEGVIVNFSSGWGRSASPEVAPYCATKYAMEGLTQALALELPEGMAAVPLNPGIVNTDMLRSCFGPSAADFTSPGEWAKMAVPFLLNLGPQHNGQSLTVG